MLPVSLLYLLVSDLYAGGIPQNHLWIYIVGMAAAVLLILFSYRWVYGATYYATYKESSVRRISLAEKLRKLPLSFFGKRDLSDLTTTIMADCTTLEQSFSHWIPEFFGSMISTVIVAVCLFIFDWRLALAALWVLPVSLAIVAFSGKVQNWFTRRQTEAKLAVAEGIQEALETMRDLKSNNAEEKYLKGLDKKIDLQEKRMIASELGGALFVVPRGDDFEARHRYRRARRRNAAGKWRNYRSYFLSISFGRVEVVRSFEFVAAKPRRHHLHEHSHRTNERN